MDADKVILKRTGISVTSRVIDLRGKTYSVSQLNSVKSDPCNHPSSVILNLAFVFCGGIGGIILLAALAVFAHGDSGSGSEGFKAVIVAAVFLVPAFLARRALLRLPKWGLLRFEMSSGSVKALDDDIRVVKEVATAIRTAMESDR